ncbi:hypothetical protein PN499_24820 [Kamptonema animale CS-326]|jgi:hypothetical protein|uniref:DUF6745 domain-containing protein n=1 Tax=Kamptonema animale TaxID=92934 RepID=UPI00232D90E2|nr:hypothetical protein [Kamptonema animale]MDB9514427.1 hypothetical protein [Kamptonema animale CS-326]
MAAKYIEELTPEQLALIPIIRDEWIKICLDTTPIDKQKAEAAICLAYECAELEPPKEILWFDNPLDAINYIASTCAVADNVRDNVTADIWNDIIIHVNIDVGSPVNIAVKNIVKPDIRNAVWRVVSDTVWDALEADIKNADCNTAWYAIWNAVMPMESLAFYSYFDAIGIDCSKAKGLRETAKHCGWWWPFNDVAVAIPKPSVIRLDKQGRLHGEGVPAIAYQGFNVYAYHGVRLPEKYGSIHPEKWQSQWLLEGENPEVIRVLIQRIGYDRICQELQAIELDSWQKYTLLRIDSNIDIEPIYLLKMTCPSTGYIHALRVPPDMATARDAITWVNWGIAPEEFAIQT